MIPPNASLVKYDNPVLVSRNTDKKTPRVSQLLSIIKLLNIVFGHWKLDMLYCWMFKFVACFSCHCTAVHHVGSKF